MTNSDPDQLGQEPDEPLGASGAPSDTDDQDSGSAPDQAWIGRVSSLMSHLPKAKRASWNLIDQMLSALTNMAMSILVARNVSAEGFGNFSVAFLLFSLAVGVVRALVASPLSIRHSTDLGAERVATARAALGTTAALGAAASTALLVAWQLIGGDLGATLGALAIVLPALLIQDTCRFAFFSWARPELATLNDLIWAIGQFSVSGVLIVKGLETAPSLVIAWGIGAAIATVVGCFQLRAIPAPFKLRSWMTRNRDLVWYMLSEYAVNQGAFQGGILLIGGFLGVGNIGSLRAAQSLTGPLGIVSSAAQTFGIPEVSRQPGLPRHTMGVATVASLAIFLLGLIYGMFLLLIPDSLGITLFGDTWAGANTVLLAVAAGSVIAGLKLGPIIFIYGKGLAKRSFRLVVILSVLSVLFMVLGAYLGDIVGLAWGMAAAQACVVPLWFLQLRSVVREFHRTPELGTSQGSARK